MKKLNLAISIAVLGAVLTSCSSAGTTEAIGEEESAPFGGQCEVLRSTGDQMLARLDSLESAKAASFDELRQKIWDAGYESPLEFYEWFRFNRGPFMVPASGDVVTPEERQILEVVNKEASDLMRSENEGRFSEAFDNLVSNLKKVQDACPLS